ncbi:MAG: hypothetical protein ABT02_08680 [Comamonadaceae bacterium SCN 68-20]|nr:MAG: hypothetical protein ABT02_08680 [Comamonadaceae bacterium SCN 68-20]
MQASADFGGEFRAQELDGICINHINGWMIGQMTHLHLQLMRLPAVIRVEECNVFAACSSHTRIFRCARALIRLVNIAKAVTVRLANLRGTIHGTIVDHQHFNIRKRLC